MSGFRPKPVGSWGPEPLRGGPTDDWSYDDTIDHSVLCTCGMAWHSVTPAPPCPVHGPRTYAALPLILFDTDTGTVTVQRVGNVEYTEASFGRRRTRTMELLDRARRR